MGEYLFNFIEHILFNGRTFKLYLFYVSAVKGCNKCNRLDHIPIY